MKALLREYGVPLGLGIISVIGGIWLHREFEQRLSVASADAQQAVDFAHTAVLYAQTQTEVADSAKHAADAANARAARAETKLAQRKVTYAAAVLAAPDTCAPVIAAADSALAAADSAIAEKGVAYDSLTVAFDAQKRATASLDSGLVKLVPATENLIAATRKSWLLKLLPTVDFHIGVDAGLDVFHKGKPWAYVGPSVSIGWTF